MDSSTLRNLVFDTIADVSRLDSLPQVSATLRDALAQFGFTTVGINGLPPPSDGAEPIILTESTPDGYRDCYYDERFYLIDHVGAAGRTAYEPFRFDEAPYDRTNEAAHLRFLQALESYGIGKGLVVPIGRPANVPVCVWFAGENPALHGEMLQVTQLIALFAANKAIALSRPPQAPAGPSNLTPSEREVLQWTAAGKTSWEISVIKGLSERAINKTIADAMVKLDAVTRAQAVVNAIRIGEIGL